MSLTEKLETFCKTLAITDDQSAAYRAMVPDTKAKPQNIWNKASSIAKRTEVRYRVAEIKSEIREKAQHEFNITQDRVLLEIARLAFNDPRRAFDEKGNLIPVNEWPDEVAAAIASIKVTELKGSDEGVTTKLKEVKFWDKGKQIELAARFLNLFEKEQKTAATALGEILKDIDGKSMGLPERD